MTSEVFQKGMALISEAFPRLEFNAKLYWKILSDLEDEDFEMAVLTVVRTVRELYPTSNLIAILRGGAAESSRRRLTNAREEDGKLQKMRLEECADPPPEWAGLKKRLGI